MREGDTLLLSDGTVGKVGDWGPGYCLVEYGEDIAFVFKLSQSGRQRFRETVSGVTKLKYVPLSSVKGYFHREDGRFIRVKLVEGNKFVEVYE